MRIANSSISMSSAREYSQGLRFSARRQVSGILGDSSPTQSKSRSAEFEGSSLSFSENRSFGTYTSDGRKKSYSGGSFNIERQATRARLKMIEREERAKKEAEELKNADEFGSLSLESIRESLLGDIKEEEAKLIKKIVEAIRKFMEEFNKGYSHKIQDDNKDDIKDLNDLLLKDSRSNVSYSTYTGTGTNPLKNIAVNKLTAMYERSIFYVEKESTEFVAEGSVTTTDGRKIDFNMQIGMERAYMEHLEDRIAVDYVFKDPLVLNLDNNAEDVSNEKFEFDIDADGEKDTVSFAGKGSGFLALDKNGDGKINDGSELFGTKSGNGFKDLSVYDDDGNGWIDENDEIFMKLLIWSKDKDGKDELVPIAKKGIGAIYLGNAGTEFSLKGTGNQTNGIIRRTGLFLKESGEAGAIKQIDLAV